MSNMTKDYLYSNMRYYENITFPDFFAENVTDYYKTGLTALDAWFDNGFDGLTLMYNNNFNWLNWQYQNLGNENLKKEGLHDYE